MTEQKTETQKRQDGHLTIYLVWPALAGIVLAGILGVSIGGLAGIVTQSLATGVLWAGVTFFVVLGTVTVFVFVYAAREWAGPRYIEWTRQKVEYVESDPAQPLIETRFIPIRAKHKNVPAPMLPAGQPVVDDRSLLTRIRAAIAPPQEQMIEMPQTAPSIEPTAATWAIEFYNVLNTMWHKPLSRRSFESQFADRGQALYYKYVGRNPPCQHRHMGLWQTWGIISRTGPRKSWEFCHGLDVIYSLDPELAAYAKAKIGMLAHSPARTVNQKPTVMGTPNQTKPVNQTRNQWTKGA